jgi:hypothetical protein
MDAFASPSIRSNTPGWGVVRTGEAVVLTLAIGLSLIAFQSPPDARLDASWQEMLIQAHAQGLQFGRDVIFTWGPWGFLCSRYHLGAVEAVPILVWTVAGSFGIAGALVVLTRSLAPWRRLAFAALFAGFHWFFQDLDFMVLITLIGIAGLMRRDAPLSRLVGWALVLGFLAQIKFTYCVISAAAVLAALVCWAHRRSWKRVAGVALGYAAAVVGAWVLAGQKLDNLYPYVMRSLDIASGYGDAMGFDESWPVFICGASLALVCALFIGRAWLTVADRRDSVGALGLLSLAMALMWKEGFTRADGHVMGFFIFILVLAPVLPGLLFPGRRAHWFDASVLLCVAGIACARDDFYRLVPRVTGERIVGNAQALGRLGSFPGEWQRAAEQACAAESLPAIGAAVGRGTADAYDFNTGAVILNRLALSARPVFQSYSAYTPSLEGWNLRFYQSDRAPDFLLWNDERVDNRYPGEDDAMLVAGLPGHYEPLFPEKAYWLFRKRSPLSKAPPERRLILSRTVRMTEEITLPPQRDHAIWLRADPVPNTLGRTRSLLYKAPLINLTTTDDNGRLSAWRLVPRVARDGFILVPTLLHGSDVASLTRGESSSWVRSFRFEAPVGQYEFWSHVDVSVFELTALPLRPVPPVPLLVALGILDRPALSVTSSALQEVIEIPEGRALLLHADGAVVLGVPAGARAFSFGYGIRDGAYSGDGHTDGVDFEVDAVWASGLRKVLWHRTLDPVARAEDCGYQKMELPVPSEGPARLELRTGPGPKGDYRWDWSYVSALRFDAPGEK